MDIEVIRIEKGRMRLKIKDETFTFGNILQKALMNDKRIIGAGYHQPHPFRKEIIFDIYFKEDLETDRYKDVVLEAVDEMLKYLTELKQQVLTSMEVRNK